MPSLASRRPLDPGDQDVAAAASAAGAPGLAFDSVLAQGGRELSENPAEVSPPLQDIPPALRIDTQVLVDLGQQVCCGESQLVLVAHQPDQATDFDVVVDAEFDLFVLTGIDSGLNSPLFQPR